jgi:DNA mismatch repair ATPase MutS
MTTSTFDKVEKYHNERVNVLELEKQKFLNRSRIWVVVRLISFSIIPLTIFFGYPLGGYSALILVAEVILFLFFVRKSAENKEELNFTKHLIQLNENELKALKNDFSAFNDGSKYIDHNHPFTYDMDVFGRDSFFQIVNRTVTNRGESTLAQRLCNGVQDQHLSLESVQELAEHPDWYQSYLAHGMQQKEEVEGVSVANWSKVKINIKSWMKALSVLLPIIAFSLTVLYLWDLINELYFLIGFLLVMMPVRQTLKQTNALHQSLSKLGDGVGAMRKQIEHLEQITFKSALLQKYQNALFQNDKNAAKSLNELSKLVKHAEYRNNILVAILLNFFLSWDHRLIMRTNQWIEQNKDSIEEWEQLIFELEALISGANYRRVFADATTQPHLSDANSAEIKFEGLGHPIIPQKKRVVNDFELSSSQHFAIITGPNMAGKSTFLRSVGVNIMMAQAGFHVMAKSFTFPKLQLYSSMRTSDDLSEDTSYFHAELLRLRFIMDAIDRGEKVFIILDEILKGTNSKDKEEGSRKFLTKLKEKGARGLIATHDLSLTSLAKEFEGIINIYFDTNIDGEEISFDYKLNDGVAKNMNASFLLKKMKLTD